MIICQCSAISTDDIEKIIDEILNKNPNETVTPAKVFKKLNKKPECGKCFEPIIEKIIEYKLLMKNLKVK